MSKKLPAKASLRPNRKKIVEAILFLIEEAASQGKHVTTYDIVKSIFVADVAHLNAYGRPITFDNYYAMKDGPVPSDVYNILTDSTGGNLASEIDGWPLWRRVPSPEDGYGVVKYTTPKRSANRNALSQTDVSHLRDALALIKAQSFSATRDMTHEHPAYIQAWQSRGDKMSVHMNYDLLLDCADSDVVSDVIHASHYA